MSAELYWFPFKIQEPGCSTVVRGPYASHDEAMKAREKMKINSTIREYIGIPFAAKDKEDAESRAHFF